MWERRGGKEYTSQEKKTNWYKGIRLSRGLGSQQRIRGGGETRECQLSVQGVVMRGWWGF